MKKEMGFPLLFPDKFNGNFVLQSGQLCMGEACRMKAMSKKKRGITIYPGKGKLLCQCFLSFAGGMILAGAKVQGYALPLGACFVAAQSLHLRMWTGLAGVIGGYFLACSPIDAMEYSSLALLMPVSALLFQSSGWTEKKWFMPLCCR